MGAGNECNDGRLLSVAVTGACRLQESPLVSPRPKTAGGSSSPEANSLQAFRKNRKAIPSAVRTANSRHGALAAFGCGCRGKGELSRGGGGVTTNTIRHESHASTGSRVYVNARRGHDGRMTSIRRLVPIVAGLILVAAADAGASDGPDGSEAGWLGEADFWIATSANVAGIGLFLARVHAPSKAPVLGAMTQLIGVPALVSATVDVSTGQADSASIGMLAYGGWAVFAATIDHILAVDYRSPRRPGILIPYVVLYYTGIGLASATQLRNGTLPWIIAGTTCIATVAASFYARARGAD